MNTITANTSVQNAGRTPDDQIHLPALPTSCRRYWLAIDDGLA
jgi:hypothetical protein